MQSILKLLHSVTFFCSYDCFDRNILWINLGINKIQCIYSEREIWVLKSETLKERNSQFTALVLLFSVNNIIQLFSTVNSNVSIFRLENKNGGVTWGPFEQSWKQDFFKGLSRYCLYHLSLWFPLVVLQKEISLSRQVIVF